MGVVEILIAPFDGVGPEGLFGGVLWRNRTNAPTFCFELVEVGVTRIFRNLLFWGSVVTDASAAPQVQPVPKASITSRAEFAGPSPMIPV